MRGAYLYVRNPMYVAMLAIVFGQAIFATGMIGWVIGGLCLLVMLIIAAIRLISG